MGTMTSAKLMLVGALVAIFLLSFDFVESQCLNCEAPNGPYCCKTSFSGNCCEYPLDRSDKSLDKLSPLEMKLKKEAHGDDPENIKQQIVKETPKEENPCKVVPCLCWPVSCVRKGKDPENFTLRNGKE